MSTAVRAQPRCAAEPRPPLTNALGGNSLPVVAEAFVIIGSRRAACPAPITDPDSPHARQEDIAR